MKIIFVILITGLSIFGSLSLAAPYGAIVINAKNGEVLHCEDCDTKLHPAGLTKLITLYVVFQKLNLVKFHLMSRWTFREKPVQSCRQNLGYYQVKKLEFVT